jgi:hypothetical protein
MFDITSATRYANAIVIHIECSVSARQTCFKGETINSAVQVGGRWEKATDIIFKPTCNRIENSVDLLCVLSNKLIELGAKG